MSAQPIGDTAATIQTTSGGSPGSSVRLDQLLARFAPISLQEMDGVALLDRTDTKMLLSVDRLCDALRHLTDRYRILEIDGRRQHHYQTLYFDTPELDFYLQHHNGKRNRYKVRERAYVDSGLTFVEVKHKTRRDRTIKHRLPVRELTTEFGTHAAAFIQTHAPFGEEVLAPTLWNSFQRITLVSTRRVERVTLDVNLCLRRNSAWFALPGVAIAEVKQARFSYDSDFLREVRYLGVRPTSFSKYCTGISMLHPGVKHNAFKPRMLHLKRLMQAGQSIWRT